MVAVLVTLPKQLAVVYLGVMFGETAQVSDPATIHKQRIISLSVFFGTAFASVLAVYSVWMRCRKLCRLFYGFLRAPADPSTSQTLKSFSRPTSARRPRENFPLRPATPTSLPTPTATPPSKSSASAPPSPKPSWRAIPLVPLPILLSTNDSTMHLISHCLDRRILDLKG